MHKALSAKQPEIGREQATSAQQPSRTKQPLQRTAAPTRLPLYAQAWGNLPPPWLRLPTPQQQAPSPEQPLQRQVDEELQDDHAPQQMREPLPAPAQKGTLPVQYVEAGPIPVYTQLAWGNQPPPWLRLPIQQKEPHEKEALPEKDESPTQRKKNTTGLPDTLKAGVENLSGLSMDDVQVHYNSAKPAQLQALAYTQGTEIHVGPGQERHLPHEAWHVVQQQQGRVKPRLQAKGGAINDDQGLEKEADAMGEKAVQMQPIFHPEGYSLPRTMAQRKPLNHERKHDSPRNMLLGTQQSAAPIQMINVGWVPSNPGAWRNVTTLVGNTAATKGGAGFNIYTVQADNVANAATGVKKVVLPANHLLSDVGGFHLPTYLQAADLTPECDHIVETQEGGANDYENARMISKAENNNPATPRAVTPAYGGTKADVDLKIYTPITIAASKKYGGPHALATGDALSLKEARALTRYANGVDPMTWDQIDRAVVNDIIAAPALGTQSGVTLI